MTSWRYDCTCCRAGFRQTTSGSSWEDKTTTCLSKVEVLHNVGSVSSRRKEFVTPSYEEGQLGSFGREIPGPETV